LKELNDHNQKLLIEQEKKLIRQLGEDKNN